MQKFVVKFVLFSIPIAFLFLFTTFFYATDKGDLIRVGYLIEKKNYRDIFENELSLKNFYTNVSSINLDNPKKYKVLSIGDSFSGQKGYGFKNYLAKNDGFSVLYFDSYLTRNPIETAFGIVNGDFFDNVKVDCIVLQSVERHIVERGDKTNQSRIITRDSIKILIKKHNQKSTKSKDLLDFPTQRIINFPLQNLLYLFDDNAYDSETYKVKTKRELFSVSEKELLFLSTDLDKVKLNNNQKSVAKLNEVLNSLSEKCKQRGITLIVLPSPDKYDFYYDEILEKQKYPRPLFFEHFEKMTKSYSYINPKKLLQEKLKGKKDIYFYDDTHWSPWSSKILAIELQKNISKKEIPTINQFTIIVK